MIKKLDLDVYSFKKRVHIEQILMKLECMCSMIKEEKFFDKCIKFREKLAI